MFKNMKKLVLGLLLIVFEFKAPRLPVLLPHRFKTLAEGIKKSGVRVDNTKLRMISEGLWKNVSDQIEAVYKDENIPLLPSFDQVSAVLSLSLLFLGAKIWFTIWDSNESFFIIFDLQTIFDGLRTIFKQAISDSGKRDSLISALFVIKSAGRFESVSSISERINYAVRNPESIKM